MLRFAFLGKVTSIVTIGYKFGARFIWVNKPHLCGPYSMKQLGRIKPFTQTGAYEGWWQVWEGCQTYDTSPTCLKPTINQHSIFTCCYSLKGPPSFPTFVAPYWPSLTFLLVFIVHSSSSFSLITHSSSRSSFFVPKISFPFALYLKVILSLPFVWVLCSFCFHTLCTFYWELCFLCFLSQC
jgi:hypothetical protein